MIKDKNKESKIEANLTRWSIPNRIVLHRQVDRTQT